MTAEFEVTTDQLKRANLPELYWRDIRLGLMPTAARYTVPITRYFTRLPMMLDDGVGLYLWSESNGTGKTSLAVLAGIHALGMGRSVFYYRSEELKEAVIKDKEAVSGRNVRDRSLEVDLLILDDLGKEYKGASGFAESVIENLLRERIQRKRATIITSNVAPMDLKTVISQDVSEVVKEALVGVEIAGPEKGGKLWREDKRRALKNLLYAEE